MIINQSRDNSFAIINTDIHTGIVKTQSRLFLSLKVLNAPIFTISTRGRVTQAVVRIVALQFYLYKMRLEEYVAIIWFNGSMCSQSPTSNSPNVMKTKIKSIKIVP